jgi:hygromycin-B 7''-O-kinase
MRRARLAPPVFATVPEYGARLGDTGFWAPYVAEVLARHGLPAAPAEVGAVGTMPTFLVGRYVVKLFGELFSGGTGFEVERSAHRLLLRHCEIPTAALVAEGRLFTEGWPWPYLITTRLSGSAWRTAALGPGDRKSLARQLGRVVRRMHDLPPPAGRLWKRDWLAEFRADCVDRHRRWGTLPGHLVDQIEAYVVAPSPVRRLVHADLHADHLFVAGADLVGVIDWGDALVADPYYELPAMHLDTFGWSKPLLAAFLEGYGWEVTADFARRAMSMTLLHRFDVLRGVGQAVDLNAVRTLDELADFLWDRTTPGVDRLSMRCAQNDNLWHGDGPLAGRPSSSRRFGRRSRRGG